MEREIDKTIDLSRTLMMLSVIIGVMTFIMMIGDDLFAYFKEKTEVAGSSANINFMQELTYSNSYGDLDMPISAAYQIIENNQNIIDKLKCNICGSEIVKVAKVNGVKKYYSLTKCMKTHMTGYVYVRVKQIDYGTFTVEITEKP